MKPAGQEAGKRISCDGGGIHSRPSAMWGLENRNMWQEQYYTSLGYTSYTVIPGIRLAMSEAFLQEQMQRTRVQGQCRT